MSTLARACPTCGAQSGDPCKNASGFRVAPHSARKGPRSSFRSRPAPGNLEHQETMQKLRPLVILRDGRCVLCASRRDLEVHHRKPTSHGGPNTLENLVALCGPTPRGCHGHVHAHPEESYASGLLLHSWDPDPTEVWVKP